MNKIKEFLSNTLGVLGIILYYILILFVSILPILVLDVPFLLDVIFLLIMQFIPFSSIVFWIWSLIVAITGPQDYVTIIFYIGSVVVYLPVIISIIPDIITIHKYK